MVFHWRVCDSKSPQVFRTLLSILTDFNNAVHWIVSVLSSISNTSNPLTKLLGIVPWAPPTIGITITCMFHSFLVLWLGLSICLFFVFFDFHIGLPGQKSFFFWLLTISRSGLLAVIWGSVCISKSQKILCITFFWTDSGLYIYHMTVYLPNPVVSSLVLFSS